VSVRTVPVFDTAGTIREWVSMATDVTERRESEEALRQANIAAERAAQAKSQFLATMSHELRTPLTAVIGITALLETGVAGPLNDGQKTHLGRIKQSAWHLVSIIEEVLTFTRSEAGRTRMNRTTVDLADVARTVVDVLAIEARSRQIEIRLQGADHPEYLFSDGGKIRQIVTNIVGNAVKFTDTGEVVVRVVALEDGVAVEVADTGPGIPSGMIEAMFEPFVQADSSSTRSKGGTGLGLAVARRLARFLGGDVLVQSKVGVGSTFTLRLPREPEPVETEAVLPV
jgi:signal transduction histidine kinase